MLEELIDVLATGIDQGNASGEQSLRLLFSRAVERAASSTRNSSLCLEISALKLSQPQATGKRCGVVSPHLSPVPLNVPGTGKTFQAYVGHTVVSSCVYVWLVHPSVCTLQVYIPDADVAWARGTVVQTLSSTRFEVKVEHGRHDGLATRRSGVVEVDMSEPGFEGMDSLPLQVSGAGSLRRA